MTYKPRFSQAVRDAIQQRFSSGSGFTVFDFADIAEQHGKNIKLVNTTFAKMKKNHLIVICGSKKNKTGGFPTNIYKIVDTRTPVNNKHKARLTKISNNEAFMKQCADNIQAALDKMEIKRYANQTRSQAAQGSNC